MKLKNIIAGVLFLLAVVPAFAQNNNNVIDEVAWVVGDQPIYKSEIEEMLQNMKLENQTIKGNPYCVIPEMLAIDKLFLYQADLDTVEAQRSMVTLEVESWLNYLISQLGSKEKVEEYLHKSIPELRELRTEMVANQSRIQQVKRDLIKDVKLTPSDVRKFYNSLPEDSVPYIPMQVEVQIITINPTIPRQEIEDIKAQLRDYSNRIMSGETEFSVLATMYSEDRASAMRGGEIGLMGKASLDPEYAAVAFNLNDPKKVSKIVESQFGYHIIQLISKSGDKINTRHILLIPKVAESELKIASERLDSVAADIRANKFSFEEVAAIVSQDKDTRLSRGVMTNSENGTIRFEMSQLPQEVALVVDTMKVGDVSDAFVMRSQKNNREIVAIVKLTNRIESHKANLRDDFQVLKNIAEENAKQKKLNEWIEKKIKETYVKIEDSWADCEFEHKGWIH